MSGAPAPLRASRTVRLRTVLLAVFLLATGLRVAFGVVKYRNILGARDTAFLQAWDHDALEHLLIAKSIHEGEGYRVDDDPALPQKHVRYVGGPAQFKAPAYQYLLAAGFGAVGVDFLAFLPLQVLAGGLTAALVAWIAWRLSRGDPLAAAIAGVLIAVHPILLNTAVQPYNESIFFCLFAITVALYLRWYDAPSWGRALLVGVVGGVGILTRESLLAPLVALAALAPLVVPRARARAAVQGGTMVVAAALVILPWSLHNSAQLGTTVPVSAISGSVLGMGNNACTAAEPLGQPFYGDNPCPALDSARAAPLAALSAQGLPYMVAFDRATGAAGAAFITAHPTDYVRLSLRRAWTTFLPKHPRQPLGVAQTAILAAYIAVTVIPGVVALALLARRGVREAWMLGLTFLAMYAPLVLIFVSHDHRFRVGMDVVAACGAGAAWAWVARRMLGRPVAAAVRG